MKKNELDMFAFCSKYMQIKESLSVYSRNMIETFISLFGEKIIKNKNIYVRKNILEDLDIINKNVDKTDNEKLKSELSTLKNMIKNNENYLDLYIRLHLILGIYPNDFFINLVYDYFYREIYIKIMNDEFIDEYKENTFSKYKK